jgi:hypothetical protein
MIYLLNFFHFEKSILKNIYYITNSLFKELQENEFNSFPKIPTIAYNMKRCLKFFTLIFLISANLAKHGYG